LTADQGSGGRGVDLAALRRRLGRIGVWFGALGPLPVAREREIVSQIESLGYPTLWITEFQKEAFAHAGLVLAATSRLTVATGIANVWAREPDTLVAGAGTLADAYDGRFVLGVGIGHAKFVGRYEQPLSTMTNYLAGMHAAKYGGAAPESPVPWLIAALRPKMLELARTQTQGSHPYFVPVEHTALARETLGPDLVLAPELAVVLDTDPESARATARRHTKLYLGLPNYVNNLRSLGWSEDDLAGTGSDRLVDAIVAWGDVDAIKRRVEEHLAAGADHVCIQAIDYRSDVAVRTISELAPVLL
jgi:probable F420-dependent oxidoreductase